MDKLDYKKEYKDLYLPKTKPALIEVPAMTFAMVDGRGDPNREGGEYQQALAVLYALSYTIKMSRMGGNTPAGYFDYVVPPLEGLWWMDDGSPVDFAHMDKERFCWTAMIRQPAFVTAEAFGWACGEAARKKGLDVSHARLEALEEGLCAQVMHLGSYDAEGPVLEGLDSFIAQQGYAPDYGSLLPTGQPRRHHEIYLTDARRCKPEKNRTVLRTPIRKG